MERAAQGHGAPVRGRRRVAREIAVVANHQEVSWSPRPFPVEDQRYELGMTDQEHDRREAEEPAEGAPPPEARRRLPRPAPPSDVKAYIPPVELPANQDDARRTQELSRVQISPELDPRRRPTVRRVADPSAPPRVVAPDDGIVVEETARLGTNLRAIEEANQLAVQDDPRMHELKQATVRMRPGAPAASPSAPAEVRAGSDALGLGEQLSGPRGTVLLNPRARGGTKMMIPGVAESAALPRRRASDAGDDGPPLDRIGLRVVVLGAVVILGLATLSLFAARGIVSPSREAPARTAEAAPSPAAPAATSEPAPSASTAADDATEEPAATTSAAPRRGRGRAKPVRRAPGAASATPRTPMFERTEGR